jgi:hypothetical protein
VPGVALGPEMAPDRRRRSPDSAPLSLLLRRRRVQAVGGWRSSPPALRALARDGAFRLLSCRNLEKCLQLLPHTPLLGGCRLRATAQQHGRRSQVLGRPPEEWWCVGVGIRAFISASVVVRLSRARGWRRCTTTRLVCSRPALTPVAVLLAGLTLHRNVLCRTSVAIPLVGLALHQHFLC